MDSVPYHERLWEAQLAYNKGKDCFYCHQRGHSKNLCLKLKNRDSRWNNDQRWTSGKPNTKETQVSSIKEKERLTNPSQSESAKRKFSQSKEESFAQITKKGAIEGEILRIKKRLQTTWFENSLAERERRISLPLKFQLRIINRNTNF